MNRENSRPLPLKSVRSLRCPGASAERENVQLPARGHLSFRGTRVSNNKRVYLSPSLGRQHALIREINGSHAGTRSLPRAPAEKFVRSVRMRAVVSPRLSVVSAVYQIAAVNPVTSGRARRGGRRRAGDRRGKHTGWQHRGRTERGTLLIAPRVMTGFEGCAVAWK